MKNCEKCFQSGESWSNCAFTAAQLDAAPTAGTATGAFGVAARAVALPTSESPTVATKSRRFSVMAGPSIRRSVMGRILRPPRLLKELHQHDVVLAFPVIAQRIRD